MQLLYPYIVKFTLHIRCTPTKWQEAQLAIVLVHNRLRTADCPCSVSCIRRCTCVPFLFTLNLQLLHSYFLLINATNSFCHHDGLFQSAIFNLYHHDELFKSARMHIEANLHDVASNDWANAPLEYSITTFQHQLSPVIRNFAFR